MNQKLINIFANLGPSLLSVEQLLTAGAYVIGIAFIVRGVMALKQVAEHKNSMQQHTMKEPLLYLLSGAMLLYFPSALNVFLVTTFGSDQILSYNSLNLSNTFFANAQNLSENLLLFVKVIGIIAFIRGWIIIAKSSSQGGQQHGGLGKGIMHVFGGVLGINIVQTLNVINNTLVGG